MLEPGEDLSQDDLERLAALHVEGIDDSVPSLLGEAYTRRFYAFVARSPHETILVERDAGRIVSAVVVTEDPDGAQLRTLRHTWAAMLRHGIGAFVTNPAFRRFVASTVRDRLRGDLDSIPAPEILYFFTDAAYRGRKLGARLVDRIDQHYRTHGRSVYYVQTIDEPDNRAIGFYERVGFVRLRQRHERGRCFVLFHKQLAA